MNYVIARFTCGRDLQLLYATHDWDAPTYWLVDEPQLHSFPASKLPSNVTLVGTTFRRNGNLNGAACLQGMYEHYKVIFAETGADCIFKVDSDTRMLNPATWDALPRKWVSGAKYPTFKSCLGCCMMYRSELVNQTVEQELADLNPIYRHPEDFSMSNIARKHEQLNLQPIEQAAFTQGSSKMVVDNNTLFINFGNKY